MGSLGQHALVTEVVFTSQVLTPRRGRARAEAKKMPGEMLVGAWGRTLAPPWARESSTLRRPRWVWEQRAPKPCFLEGA